MEARLPALLMLALQLLTAGPGLLRAAECEANDIVSVEVTVSARRNASGHWVVKATSITPSAGPRPELSLAARLTAPGRACSGPGPGQATLLSASAGVSRPSAAGYERFPGLSYYRLVTAAAGWVDAEKNCSADGGYLMVINSPQEANVVREFFARGFKAVGGADSDWVYVGFHDRYVEGEFVTVFGHTVKTSGYNSWVPGWKSHDDWDCGCVDHRALMAEGGCGTLRAYVCEVPAPN